MEYGANNIVMSAFGLANRLLDKVNSIIQPPTTIFQNDTMPWSVIIVNHNRGRKPCNYYYGILGLDGHTVVVSLTFSTDLVMTFSFLVAWPEGTDEPGDGAVVSSATTISWKTGLDLIDNSLKRKKIVRIETNHCG